MKFYKKLQHYSDTASQRYGCRLLSQFKHTVGLSHIWQV